MENTARPSALLQIYRSSIGKKLITGITGLGLVLFVGVHLVGNLLLFVGHDAYNGYAHHLEALGPLLWTVETLLALVFGVHAIAGIHIFVDKLRARPEPYSTYTSRSEGSLQTLSSRTMILTGGVLAVFLIWHLLTFKFGPRYPTALEGQPVRDLARLVVEKFQQPTYAFGYSGVMALLGFHLRHGLWSALQSLGVLTRPIRLTVFGLSLLGAGAIAIGFMALPLCIYFGLVN